MKLVHLLLPFFILQACSTTSQFRLKEINHPISVVYGADRTDAYNAVRYVVKNYIELKGKNPFLKNTNIQEIYSVSKSRESAQYFCELWVNFHHEIGSTSVCLIKKKEVGEFIISNIVQSSH